MESRSHRPAVWTFFRQWLKNPLSVAAISPSSRQLAQQMMAQLPPDCRRVIELGGGTGVFTQALLNRGIAREDLLVLELNEELHHHLSHRFPGVRIICADAADLPRVVQESGYANGGPADAVVSGLGLLSMSKAMQKNIIAAAFAVMAPEGRFIQFTYGPTSPIAREVLQEIDLSVQRGNFAWRNVPPATVYVVTRNRSKAIPARAMQRR